MDVLLIMKYTITEERITDIKQSEVNMGPLGGAIRQAFDLYDLPQVISYLVLYVEKDDEYWVLVFSNRYYSSETKEKVELFIEKMIPARILMVFNTIDY